METETAKRTKELVGTYMGDGVYAAYDGWHIWLDLRGQGTEARIALDPVVFAALLQYQMDVAGAGAT